MCALVDLWFADKKDKEAHTCKICLRNPTNSKVRKCFEPGFNNLSKPRKIDDFSLEYSFCAGKATWYEDAAILFDQCRVAAETGILPSEGSLEDQDDLFAEAFPAFIERWRERTYQRVWKDTRGYVKVVLESLFSGKKGKK